MSIRTGILSTAHVHAPSYAHALKASGLSEFIGIADEVPERGKALAERCNVPFFDDYEMLAGEAEAVAVVSENTKHRALVELAAKHHCHVICEKPLCTTMEDGRAMVEACKKAGVQLMTCFPCRYAPSYTRLAQRLEAGDVGKVLAICATNHGMMPQGSWFNDPALSGGGSMMDHTVHVADLLRCLLKSEAVEVYAETGNGMYHGADFEDIAMLTVRFDNGVFATIDSSWSRPVSYKTWGDVTMNVVGDKGVIELDMFGPGIVSYRNSDMRAAQTGYGSNADAALIEDFLTSLGEGKPVSVSGEDGLKASEIAIAGYASAKSGQPASLPI
jgi:predicted dehydrogenase